jgi:DNA-binding Lrp family transcriptional regulator
LVNAVTDELASFDAIYTIASSFGRFDIIALVQCASADELQSFIRDELPKVSGIKGIETFILMRPRKYHGVVWRAGNKV